MQIKNLDDKIKYFKGDNMTTIESYFEKKSLSAENVEEAYKFFGYEALVKYFNKENEKLELIKEYKENKYFIKKNIKSLDKGFLSRIGDIPLLTIEEEQKYGYYLKLLDKLVLFRNNNNLNDLGCIFVSLTNNDNYEDVLKLLDTLFSLNKFNEDKILKKYLRMYKKESTILNRPLTKEELNKLFKNELFKNFAKYKEINNKQLLEQINSNVKYEIAKEQLFNANLRLVLKYAYEYKTSDNDLLDILNEGCIGLMKAIDKFDITQGNRFSTYATFWIKQNIKRSGILNSNSMKVSVHFPDDLRKFNKKVSNIEAELKRPLTMEEIYNILNIKEEKITEFLNYDKKVLSLDTPINNDVEYTLNDFIEGKNAYEKLEQKIIKEEVSVMFELLETNEILTKKEIDIIKLSFGIDTKDNISVAYKEIAKKYNNHPNTIKKTINKGLKKIKSYAKSNCKIKELEVYVKK